MKMIFVYKNEKGLIELTQKRFEELLEEARAEGYNQGCKETLEKYNWGTVINAPLITSPYEPTCTDNSTITVTRNCDCNCNCDYNTEPTTENVKPIHVTGAMSNTTIDKNGKTETKSINIDEMSDSYADAFEKLMKATRGLWH